jgi:signal transduction histidine kinase
MKPALPISDIGLEARDATLSAPPCLTIDVARGLIVEANPAALAALALDAAPVVLPLPVDSGMPAIQQLKRLACLRQVALAENLTFWTPRGVRQMHCQVRRAPGGEGLFIVRLAGDRAAREVRLPARQPQAAREIAAAAKLAHELRTPLGAAIAYAEVLKDEHFGPLGNARYREYARNIYDSARHALGVVDGMLAASGPAPSGLPEFAFTDLDPAGIVENCLTVARPLADKAGLELAAEMLPGTPRIVADEVSLKQMLLNLLTNAIKFGRRGDRVTVGVTYELGGPLRIAVSDTGPGMAEPPLALEGGRTSNGKSRVRNAGLGIGLPLTRSLAEANGAALVIDSAPGRGTRVTIAFAKDRVVPV